MNSPYSVSPSSGVVRTISGTSVLVWPPLRSSVWAMSAVGRLRSPPLAPQIVPSPAMPAPTAGLVGTFVSGGP